MFRFGIVLGVSRLNLGFGCGRKHDPGADPCSGSDDQQDDW